MSFTVYKSSAGSGKTFTLVKEYLKIALGTDQTDKYQQILAITFTNKAANEMKERVISTLRVFGSGKKVEGGYYHLMEAITSELNVEAPVLQARAQKTLEHLLHHYSRFSVSTIDKFVHRIVRTFAHDLKIPMNFEVELDDDVLLRNAIDLLITQIGNDKALTEILVNYTEDRADDEKSWDIQQDLHQFAKNLLKEESHYHFDQLRAIQLDEFLIIKKKLNEVVYSFEDSIESIGVQALQLIHSNEIEKSAFAGGKNGLPKYFEYLANKRRDKLLPSSTVQKNMAEEKWHSGKASEQDKMSIDAVAPQLTELYRKALQVIDNYYESYQLFRLINQDLYALAVLNEIEKLLHEIKEANNILHISEFNKKIAQIVLTEPVPFIYERLGEKYKHYLVDEFQDTSVLQWQNLLPLIDNSLAGGNFNMIVGDGKQAIYRWRGGEVEQFAQMPEVDFHDNNPIVAERQATLQRNYNEQVLENNFRSKSEIVKFNNFFFNNIAQNLDEANHTIYHNLEQHYLKGNEGGYISIHAINYKETNYEEETLQRIHDTIQELSNDHFRLEDIVILCRKNKEASLIAEYLLNRQINVISSESLLLNSSPKVRFMAAIFKLLNNQQDLNAQAEVITFLVKSQVIKSSLHESLSELSPDGNINAFIKVLQRHGIQISLRSLSLLPIYECAESIFRQFFRNEKDPFLSFFLEFIYNFTTKHGNNISELLEEWEEKKEKQSIILTENDNAVQIMTIHKAKGLEFPAVIFPFANWRITPAKDHFWLQLDQRQQEVVTPLESVLVPVHKDLENTAFAAQYEEEKNKALLDNINLLYVAFTRPRERLYVLTSDKDQYRDLSKQFLPFLKNTPNWDETEAFYRYGQKVPHASEEKPPTNSWQPGQFVSGDWSHKIRISLNAPEVWNLETLEEEKKYGKLIHKALSGIITVDDISPVINNLKEQGILAPREAEAMKNKLTSLLNKIDIQPFFQPGLTTKNEQEIILEDNTICRPDKVITENDKAIIIDYKTGKQQKQHEQQLERYQQALQKLGFKTIEKYLLYTDKEVIVQV